MKKLIATILAAACMLSVLAGCGGGKQPEGEAKDTVTVIGFLNCETYNPLYGGTMDMTVVHAIYDSLVGIGPDGGIVPRLAESYEESADGQVLTLKLRQDVTFHNGDKFTADDVIFTLDTMLENPKFYFLSNFLSSHEKVDEYTVKLTKSTPYCQLLNCLAEYVVIVPKDYYTQKGQDAFAEEPIGCGPYKFVSKDVAGNTTLEAYDGFYGEKQTFKNAVIKVPLEPANALIALETREADLLASVPSNEVSMVKSKDQLTLVSSESWSTWTLLLMGEPLKSDINLRKAIFHGISRENAILLANEGLGEPTEDLFSKMILGDMAGSIDDFVGYDEELAKQYLEQSNYNGEPLKLTIYTNSALALSTQSDLNKIGIKAEIEQLDVNGWLEKRNTGEMQMAFIDQGISRDSTVDSIAYYLKDNQYYGCYMEANSELEALMEKVPVETDSDVRRQLVKESMNILYDMANIVPLYDVTFYYAHGPNISYDYPFSATTGTMYLEYIKAPK